MSPSGDIASIPGQLLTGPPKTDRFRVENSRLVILAGGKEMMKKSRLSERKIAFVLRQAEEGTPAAKVCRKAGAFVLRLAQEV